MDRLRSARRLFAALLLAAATAAMPAQDAQPPRRIVALAPHLAELACAAGGCERLVGVSRYSDFPPQLAQLPQVSDGYSANFEAVLALHPDLILAWDGGTPAATVERLHQLRLRVEWVKVRHLDDVAGALEQIGAWLGTETAAHEAAQRYRARLAELRQRWHGATPIRVLYQIETAPAYTVNRDSPISEAIALCGGVNVFAGLPRIAEPVSAEAMLAAQPEAVLFGGQESSGAAIRTYWSRLSSAPAVQRGALYAIDANLLARAGPRMADGVEQVCEKLEQARRG